MAARKKTRKKKRSAGQSQRRVKVSASTKKRPSKKRVSASTKKRPSKKKRVSASTKKRATKKKKLRRVTAAAKKAFKKRLHRARARVLRAHPELKKIPKDFEKRLIELEAELREAKTELQTAKSALEVAKEREQAFERQAEKLISEIYTARRLSVPELYKTALEQEHGHAQIVRRMREKIEPDFLTPREGGEPKGFVVTDETTILLRLIAAEQLGTFETEAGLIADEYEWPINEVYTLWFSP